MERKILGITMRDRISNESLSQMASTTNVTQRANKLKWKWGGHIARMKDERWTYRATMWDPRTGDRHRGRPRKRWADFYTTQAGALQISSSEEEDQGKYECVAENVVGTEYSHSTMLYVKVNIERIPNLTGEQSNGITVFRIPPMTSLMLHRCRTGAINLQRWWQSPSAAISESDWFLYRAGISRRITSCTVVSWRCVLL
ncbi:hypothetical protein ANN_25210 [Periplaneta americana]|uniref:Ig-like domain-containing protein n=1 Tax=Periplaneta americana TaxID=6978 RepID=A0ABQ8S0Y1_PERAM|nr:hypothetical protein ANN_25210 [Periplaneta americana]